jgi:putative hydrolase of the HAD superfamily
MGMFGVHKPYQRLMQGALEEYHRPELQLWQLYPDSLETLVTLETEGYQLGLISNANSDWAVNAILRKFEIHRFFKIILTSAALRIRKPRPAIFLKALDALKTLPKETVFVGDSFDADVIGARNVGIHAIHLRRKPTERVILVEPEVTVTSLSEAVKIINSWAKTA